MTGGRAQPVPGTSHHGQRMMERRDAVPVRAVVWKPQWKAFHPHEPDRADSRAEDGAGCFREGEPSRILRGFLV